MRQISFGVHLPTLFNGSCRASMRSNVYDKLLATHSRYSVVLPSNTLYQALRSCGVSAPSTLEIWPTTDSRCYRVYCYSPHMSIPRVYGISTDDGSLGGQPEQGMVNRILLQRPRKHNRRVYIPIKHEQAVMKGRCFGRGGRDVLSAEDSGPVLPRFIFITITPMQHVD